MKKIGPESAKLIILKDTVSGPALYTNHVMGEYEQKLFKDKISKAIPGMHLDDTMCMSISSGHRVPTEADYLATLAFINSLKEAQVIVSMGEKSLKFLTGLSSVDKWQCSQLNTNPEFDIRKCVPSYPIDRINKDPRYHVYTEMCFEKAAIGLFGYERGEAWKRKPYNFILNPDVETAIQVLSEVVAKQHTIAVDIETGKGQINTVGFAWSPTDAIAIRTLPKYIANDQQFHRLWRAIANIMENQSIQKIYQNNAYEAVYFASYGIKSANTWHDTQWAQKFLWPEFEKGLATVGRFYTDEMYWKDMGRKESEEGKQKDWAHIPDWEKHLTYNCMDTTGTFEAAMSQRAELAERGLFKLYRNYIMRLAPAIVEMCTRGLPIDPKRRDELRKQVNEKIEQTVKDLNEFTHPYVIENPGSPKQKMEFLAGHRGYKVPQARGADGKWSPSTNELSLKKLMLKHPDDKALEYMIEYSKQKKALSAYIEIGYHESTNRVHFTMDGHGTETGRFTGYKDPWDRGFNPLTLSKGEAAGKSVNVKSMFDISERPEYKDCYFFEVDLDKAETWFVARDSADPTLMEMLTNGEDIHRYVASKIYEKDPKNITKAERQLGKKAGHGANYRMSAPTFQHTCLKEMNVVLTKQQAEAALDGYFNAFPKVRDWQHRIEKEVMERRMLKNPLGRVRYFYGRVDDSMFREACAYRPQSTIPDITNHLMLHLLHMRNLGHVKFDLHLQTYDSLLLIAHKSQLPLLHSYCKNTEAWHPEIYLKGGRLVIPTGCEVGKNWGQLKEYEGGLIG